MTRLRLAVIGVGHLGKEHARILAGLPEVELAGVADVNAAQGEAVALRCGTRPFADYRALLPRVDAAVVVVPTAYHHAVAVEFLRRGLPVLVEKPLAADLSQAGELVELARRQGVTLQVGHIERFNPAFEELCRRPLRPRFVTCERLGSFTGRSSDIGAVLDLMIHDLDLLLALVRSPVRDVQALGLSVLGGHEDVAAARLVFENGCVANLSASRVSAAPLRRMQVWSAEGFACVDFAKKHLTLVQPSEELRQQRLDPRRLDAAALALLKAELYGRHLQTLELDCQGGDQLTRELQDFLHCVRTGERPRASGEDGRDALALATRVLDSLRAHRWEGHADGPAGPLHLPAAAGQLFQPAQDGAAA
ncbi:MAG TPA: Gfo/Idh/MocA family oxidoreductase [Gemmataceae bacterium]|nr:Gfo/Idh/MocA family oxidoreductase [Gemmataceae bacterium]